MTDTHGPGVSPDPTVTAASEPTDSEVVLDLVERLTARGYTVRIDIRMPGGHRMTLTGEPEDGA